MYSEEFDDVIKQSYVKLRKKKVGTFLWQKKWIVLKRACSKGPRRLEVFSDEQACLVDGQRKVIKLGAGIRKVQGDPRKHSVEVICNDDTNLTFACDSAANTKEWVSALETDDGLDPLTQQNSDIFNVYLLPSSILNDFGECLLQVTEDHIRLLRLADISQEIAAWPLISLRKYGRDETKFTFECGRKCETGEGVFILNTTVGEEIYKKVHSATQAIATTYRLMHPPQGHDEFRGDHPRAPPLAQKTVSSPTMRVSPMHSPLDGGDIAARAPIPLPRPEPAGPFKVYTSVRTLDRKLPPTPDSLEYQGLAEDESRGPSYTIPGARRQLSSPTTPVAAGNSGPGMNGFPGSGLTTPNSYQQSTSANSNSYSERHAMPLPAVPGTPPVTPPRPLDDIYEENGLNPQFRQFLASRKDAPT